jgi:hypothetical protein
MAVTLLAEVSDEVLLTEEDALSELVAVTLLKLARWQTHPLQRQAWQALRRGRLKLARRRTHHSDWHWWNWMKTAAGGWRDRAGGRWLTVWHANPGNRHRYQLAWA